MASSGGLPGGGGGGPLDLYGDLFTDEQKRALQQRDLSQGLLGFAAKLGAASAPSREPKSGFLGLLGQAAGGFASQGDEQALKGMEIAEKVRESRRKRAALTSYQAMIEKALVAAGIDPKSPQGQQAIAAGAGAAAAPVPPGAPQGGPLASNAPPPPPTGLPPDIGDIAGPPSWATQPPPGPQPSTGIGAPEGVPSGGAAGAEWLPNLPVPPSPPPGPQTGLLPPPTGTNPQMGGTPGMGGGLLAGLPFNMAAGLAPGAVGPDLQQLASLMREDAGGGGDDIEFPFPTRQDPNKPRSAWQQGYTYDQPKVPYGQAPEDRVRPGGRPDDARLDALTRQYESGDRNIMQQVNATSTSGGYYQINNPTWRDISSRAGIDLEKYPTAISAPREVQAAAAKALRETRGMQPWQSNTRLMAAVGGNLPDVGRVRIEPLGGEAAPAGQGGVIPGINMTPTQLGLLNALGELGGLDSPFKSLLDTYYKSPGYLGEKARTEAQAGKDVALTMDPKIEAAKAAATQKYIQENETHKNALDMAKDLVGKGVYLNKETGRMEPIQNAAQALAEIDRVKEQNKADLQLTETTLTFPGEGRPRTVQMTGAQARAVAEGREVQVGGIKIPAMTGIKIGKPVYNPTETALGPIEAKAIFENHQLASDAATTIETNKEARRLLDAGAITGFGADKVTALTKLGNALGVTGRDSQDLVSNTESYMATTAANVGRMIKQFGAGTGLSDADRDYAAQMAAGKITLDETSIRKILDINDRASLNIINRHNQRVSKIAPGATMTDLSVPAPEPYKSPEKPAATTAPATAPPTNAPTATGPGGQKLILRNGQWVPQ